VSSKQIGEEITALYNQSKSSKSMISCHVADTSISWPLYAYEMMLSVEQEEKVVQAFKRCEKVYGSAL